VAGHSHSANIARRKGAVDAKRGKVFSKLARVIITAARIGGGDPDANLRLKYAIEKARAANMPKDNIERAIKRGSGSKDGDSFEELNYEGYAAGGVALLVVCLTDNRNRTAPDVKYIFDRNNGNLGSPGSVSFLFHLSATFAIETQGRDEDALTELALEVGADEIEVDGDTAVLQAGATEFPAVQAALKQRGETLLSSELAWVPQNRVPVTDKDVAAKVLRLIAALEDHDDVQTVYTNYDMPAEWIEEYGG
jgi:YebC/PmpR family DNA-binding regulatory protein